MRERLRRLRLEFEDWQLRNWWAAQPWRIVGRGRWRYWTIYRTYREGSWNPREGRWVWGAEPKGRLRSLWGALAFPHVHEDMEDFRPDWTVPPGDTLLELMAERRMLFSDLARLMLEDEARVQKILAGVEPVTISDALTFEEVFGVSADFWMNMERRYREDLARGARRSVA